MNGISINKYLHAKCGEPFIESFLCYSWCWGYRIEEDRPCFQDERETREEKMVSSKKHFRDVDVDTGCGPRPE